MRWVLLAVGALAIIAGVLAIQTLFIINLILDSLIRLYAFNTVVLDHRYG